MQPARTACARVLKPGTASSTTWSQGRQRGVTAEGPEETGEEQVAQGSP